MGFFISLHKLRMSNGGNKPTWEQAPKERRFSCQRLAWLLKLGLQTVWGSSWEQNCCENFIEAFYNFPEACFVPIHGSSRGVLSTLQQLFQPTAPSDALVGLELTSAVGFRTKLSRGQPRGFNRAGSAKWNLSHQVEGQTKEAHSLSWVRRQSDGQITLICPLKPTLQLARVHRNCSIGKLILPRQQVPRGVTEPKAENDPIFRAFISSQNKQVPPNTNTGGSHTKINHYKSLSSSMNSIALKKIIMVYLLCRGPVLEVSGNCFTT